MAKQYTAVTTHIDVDFGPRNRVTVFFRLLLGLPALALLSLLTSTASFDSNDRREGDWFAYAPQGDVTYWADGGQWSDGGGGAPLVMIPIVLLLLFMGLYPTWLLTFVHAVQSFSTRVAAYMLLLRDEYPHVLERPYAYVTYPDIEEGRTLSRGLPLVKWLLAIPHYLVLAVVTPFVLLIAVLAWVAIVFSGRYPQGLAGVAVWYIGYANRVYGYAVSLVTDSYPRLTEN